MDSNAFDNEIKCEIDPIVFVSSDEGAFPKRRRKQHEKLWVQTSLFPGHLTLQLIDVWLAWFPK